MNELWCGMLNMWCSDTDDEDHMDVGCKGECWECKAAKDWRDEEEVLE